MPYPGFFAPLERTDDGEAEYDAAVLDLVEAFEDGVLEPCSKCRPTDPCDGCVDRHIDELRQEAAERRAGV